MKLICWSLLSACLAYYFERFYPPANWIVMLPANTVASVSISWAFVQIPGLIKTMITGRA